MAALGDGPRNLRLLKGSCVLVTRYRGHDLVTDAPGAYLRVNHVHGVGG